VLHRAEVVHAPQTAADGGLEHRACFMSDEEQFRDDAAASRRFLMQSDSNVLAESAPAWSRAADSTTTRQKRPDAARRASPARL
jgi:hypothetical protein